MRACPAALLALALTVFFLATTLVAEAHEPGKVWRVGYLLPASASPALPRDIEGFRQGLRERGYVERRNIVIEVRDPGGKPERLAALVAELVQLNVDVIVANGTQAILAAKQA